MTMQIAMVIIGYIWYMVLELKEKLERIIRIGWNIKKDQSGAFEPRKLKREKVKEVLLSFRRDLQENARSECIESGHPTFDYI